ncbi:uncharacterized protein LOC108245751 isoform X2 [Kryptolebias marmoratus]|uniref:uncharacterized protein LOC108245751 isoform X2 n=1 Tax=Kryptolebias marmoratus TaxID=37003 RepID=UPI000D52F692|nr:uncharacterized protein LOC108245751 isoform X2 [Kryptolebias marmoratus]
MAASPCRFTPERYWTEEKERALIAFFSKHSCLWNHKSENYKNRQLRWKTLDHLRVLLSSQPPPVPFTVEDIKNKFKNLRTTFQRQYKMFRASRACGSDDVFVPQWKHYQQLMFLQGCWDQDNGLDEPPPPPLLAPASPLDVTPEDSQPSSFLPSLSTSSASSGVLVKSYWTEERERALIRFYEEHGCLWSKKSENYNNRQLRQKLLDSLRSRLSDRSVSFSVEDIKCKFKNLRTVFNREHKSVQASQTSDKPYVSKWKHYQQLLFLCESADEDECPDDLQVLLVQEERGRSPPSSGVKLSDPSAAQAEGETGAMYAVLLPASPDRLKPPPPSPPGSLPDRKPCLVQADGRPGADSRCLWSEVKVQQLISFYAVEDIKTKFRNLRTIFQREHKAVSANRTCGSEDFYLPKWKHYQDLMFLCESCDEDAERPEDFPRLRSSSSNRSSAAPSPTPPDSPSSSPSTASSSPADIGAPGRKRASRRPPPLPSADKLMELMRSVCRNRSESPHAGFLKYVEECLNETPPDKVRRLKKKIIETLHEAAENV